MTEDIKPKSLAIIIAIEEYRFNGEENGITNVLYAKNDAIKFKKLLKEEFGLAEEDIILWSNKDATKSALEDELKYNIRQLTKEHRFYFYYAGHGFYQGGHNKITCWDSHPGNLDGTTVSLKDILLDPLEESECTQSLIFLDTCSTYLKDGIVSRDLIANFSSREFEEFLNSEDYRAIFMSCSPGEKSYPSELLSNGIWTYHLIEALKGNIPEALVKDEFITDASLKNYLSAAIPAFITNKTNYKTTQKPYAKISSSNDFLIRKLIKPEEDSNNELPQLTLKFDSAVLRRIVTLDVRKASGFKKSHFVPDKVNGYGDKFMKSVFNEDLEGEIQEVYQNTKDVFSLRKRQIDYGVESGSGVVQNDFFRYFVDIEQDEKDPGLAKVTRTLQIRVDRHALPDDFDDIFPKQIDEIVLQIDGEIDFDELVEKFENLEEEDGGKLYDNELKGEIEYITYSGLSILIDSEESKLIISPRQTMKCLELIDTSIEGLAKISSGSVKLLS